MIFAHTIDKVLNGTKTMTRRVIDPLDQYCGEERDYPAAVFSWRVKDSQPARAKYIVGKTYAVQRGRGKKAEVRIRITGIRREDVRNISEADAQAEGFSSRLEFWKVWTKMHCPKREHEHLCQMQPEQLKDKTWAGVERWAHAYLMLGSDENYQAWAISFCLVEV